MIGGVNSNIYGPLQPERPVQRGRNDFAQPENRESQVRPDRQLVDGSSTRQQPLDPQLLERHVQAREAAKDARFESFRADEVPLANAQALDVFTGIASQREDGDVELAGVDIHV